MDNHDYSASEQQKRVLQALRDMGHRIDTIRQTRVDDYGRKHPAVAVYVLVEGKLCA